MCWYALCNVRFAFLKDERGRYMAYKNTALSFAVLMSIVVACNDQENSSVPEFGKQTGPVASANTDVADHGAENPDGSVQPPVASNDASAAKPVVPAAKPAASVPPPAPAPGAPTQEDAFKAMLAAGKVMNTVTIEAGKGQGWGTTTAARLEVFVAVDAAGAPIVPAGVNARQIPSGTPGAMEDAKFQANNADVAGMHSSLRVCNNSGEAIYLHSGNGGPFAHGSGPIANATCAQFLAQRAAANDGATYDHTDGNNIANYVYLKVTKVGPDGKVVP